MPRRELLTPAERAQLLAFPTDESELIRRYTLSRPELAYVRAHRGSQNRLGIAIQLSYLQHPGRVLAEDETPPPALLGIVAAQIRVSPALWGAYATRDQTRREHQQEAMNRLGLSLFGAPQYRDLREWLVPTAMQTTQGITLAEACIAEIRRRRFVVPPVRVIERLVSETATRAQRQIYQTLTDPLTDVQRVALDGLLDLRGDAPYSTLAWLKFPAGAPSARAVLTHIERLKVIRAIGLPPDLGKRIHQNRLLRLAREGAQTAIYHLKDYELQRRYATLVAILLDTAATLTDEILDLHDRLIGSFFAKAKHKHERSFAEAGPAINAKVRLFAQIGAALIGAKEHGSDPFAAIEALIPWDEFLASVAEAETLARDQGFDHLGLLLDHFGQLRRYGPTFLDTFTFRAAPAVQPLLDAIETLRQMNAAGARRVPDDAPVDFVRRRWARFVFADGDIDRRYYELCAMAELKNALRAGDIWVVGSRQYRDFEDYLLPADDIQQQTADCRLGLAVPTDRRAYLDDRLAVLRESLTLTDALARTGELPDAELTERGLSVIPLVDAVPAAADRLIRDANGLLPHLKITDLLLEVDRRTDFSRHFTHLKTGELPKDRPLLLTAVLADGINLGLTKMAEACPGTSLAKLSWLVAWHIRDDTYSKALAELVNYQHRLPFAAHWGEGTTSSSDGQRYRAGGHGESAGHVNARYGNEPGVLFYTHVSDQYAPFHTKVINAAVRDATHVLDGLLYHESELQIEEHYTDTAGFTDHVFALCHLLGFRFAPRIRDLADKRIYVPGAPSAWPALTPLIGGSLNLKLIEQQFDEVIRLAASIKQGTVTASLILRKLAAYPRQNSLALALRELGRIERTLFTLQWLRDPALRRRVNTGLNKGEARNALARAVFFNRLGEIRDRSFENQRYRASGLNLIVAAITLWNTVYLERAVAALGERGAVDESLFRHLSPLSWEHIHLTGDYVWHANRRVAKGRFRPLRQSAPVLVEA
jgi:TnpA family transposase